MNEGISWNPGEPMSKEFALEIVGSVRRFIKWRYLHPETEEYEPEIFLGKWMEELDALEGYIKDTPEGLSAEGTNS